MADKARFFRKQLKPKPGPKIPEGSAGFELLIVKGQNFINKSKKKKKKKTPTKKEK